MTLTTVGGGTLTAGSGIATQVTSALVGSLVKTGNFQTHNSSPFQAFTSMWGVFLPQNNNLVFTCDMQVFPNVFPARTKFNWDVTPDPDWAGVNGYLSVMYGNYDDSVGGITPRQVKNITTLVLDSGWVFTGDTATGLLCECWLTTDAHATGPTTGADNLFEVGFIPKVSPSAQAWLTGSGFPTVGSFTDSNGALWNVVQADNPQSGIYYVATRPSFADHHGIFDFKAYFAFLTGAGEITGNEYFNGLAFGAEAHSGAGSVTFTRFSPTYT